MNFHTKSTEEIIFFKVYNQQLSKNITIFFVCVKPFIELERMLINFLLACRNIHLMILQTHFPCSGFCFIFPATFFYMFAVISISHGCKNWKSDFFYNT